MDQKILLAGGVILLLVTCSGGSKPPPGKACLMNSECQSPLVCTFGKCHSACAEARDCPTGQLCVKGPGGSVCQLPAESRCATGAECASPLVCALDHLCRSDCSADGACPTGTQKCLMADRICAEPEELDSTGSQLKNAVPRSDAGVDTSAPADAAADLAPAGTCADHQQNGGETDMDCGGSCPACALGKTCKAPTDCASGLCGSGKCLECTPGTTRCAGKRQSSCMGGLWVPANEDCASGCDTSTNACRVCAPSTCKTMKVIFHGAVDGNADVQLAVDDGKVYRTSLDTDPMIGQKTALFGNFTDDRKQYTTDNTACGLPDFGKHTNVYYPAPLDGVAVTASWYGGAEDFAAVKTCQSCPNFGCDNFISTPKRIDAIETVAASGDLTCKVCFYSASPPADANLIRCLSPNAKLAGTELDPMKPPVLLQLDDGKRCASY
jgi:hypothetical protein